MSDSTDAGRQEAQRQALAGLLTRFTADRDELYAGIQGCREQLADLLTRLDAGDPAAATVAPVSSGATHPAFDEVPALLEQVRAQEAGVAEARALAAAASERAQEAVRLAAQQAEAAVTWRAELTALERKIEGVASAPSGLDVGKEVRGAMGELRKDLERVESALRERIEAKERTTAENFEAETQLLRRQLEKLADNMVEKVGPSEEISAVHAALDELRGNILKLQAATEQRPEPRLRTAAADWEIEVGLLRDRVKELATHQVREAASAEHLAEMRRAIDGLRTELSHVQRSVTDRPLPPASSTGDLEVRVKSLQEKVEELTRQGKESASAEYLVAVSAAIEHLRGDLARVESTLEDRIEARMRNTAAERDTELRRLREKVEEMTGVRSAIESLRIQLGRTESAVGDRIEARIRSATESWEAQAASLRVGMQELAVVQRHTFAKSAAASAQAGFAACARMAEELSDRLATLVQRASATPGSVSRAVRTRLADVLQSTLRRVAALLP